MTTPEGDLGGAASAWQAQSAVAAGNALAPWASDAAQSRGRRIAETAPSARTEHQRDRDRIVHSTAFRRLVYKTQVFVNHEGDLFRTRLTHSLEVAQLARSMARQLRLNEDLVEAIALAHDLGHTPFGHAGQDALHDCMRDDGGFEHNLQSLRVVDQLEVRYPSFDGLNLTFETREGILKHCSQRNALRLQATEPRGPAQRFVDGMRPSLEAQLVDVADEMAYNTHDIDDGVRSGLISTEQLQDSVPLFAQMRADAVQAHPPLADAHDRRLLFDVLRRMLSTLVAGVVAETSAAVGRHAPSSADHVRALPQLAGFGVALQSQVTALKRFLSTSLYRHPQVQRNSERARGVVIDLYAAYQAHPAEMPVDYAVAADRARSVADYIAGMTDRHALREHARLTGRDAFAD